jgi:hypothetical protein
MTDFEITQLKNQLVPAQQPNKNIPTLEEH